MSPSFCFGIHRRIVSNQGTVTRVIPKSGFIPSLILSCLFSFPEVIIGSLSDHLLRISPKCQINYRAEWSVSKHSCQVCKQYLSMHYTSYIRKRCGRGRANTELLIGTVWSGVPNCQGDLLLHVDCHRHRLLMFRCSEAYEIDTIA